MTTVKCPLRKLILTIAHIHGFSRNAHGDSMREKEAPIESMV